MDVSGSQSHVPCWWFELRGGGGDLFETLEEHVHYPLLFILVPAKKNTRYNATTVEFRLSGARYTGYPDSTALF